MSTPRNIHGQSVHKLWQAVTLTNIADFYLCFSPQMSDHIKEYERFLGMQTLVSSNIYQYCGFLPVFLRTEVRQHQGI
ncbi:DNA polymerase III PolC-type [Trichinella spiralis]|uniref:DNA polymerase III PolC-type n=3 Tax=Trichinella spiralis TaxID=6334 RepID=A0ABR3KCG0_TRISP